MQEPCVRERKQVAHISGGSTSWLVPDKKKVIPSASEVSTVLFIVFSLYACLGFLVNTCIFSSEKVSYFVNFLQSDRNVLIDFSYHLEVVTK